MTVSVFRQDQGHAVTSRAYNVSPRGYSCQRFFSSPLAIAMMSSSRNVRLAIIRRVSQLMSTRNLSAVLASVLSF